MLIGLMAEMLKHFLQINFDLAEGLDCINPAPGYQWPSHFQSQIDEW
jgi:hypothetical protein